MFEFHSEYCIVKCGNKELNIRIVCEYEWETDLPDVEFESDEENKKYLKRFETGELSNLWVKVTAISLKLGEIADDNLGGIHVLTSDTENQLMEAVKENQMIDNVVEKLISNLENKYRALKGYFE
jgi:hypothetical protein